MPRRDRLDVEAKLLVLNAVIEEIVISQTSKRGNTFDPDRVAIRWRLPATVEA